VKYCCTSFLGCGSDPLLCFALTGHSSTYPCSKTRAHSDILIPIFHFCEYAAAWIHLCTAAQLAGKPVHVTIQTPALTACPYLCRHVTAQQPSARSSELNQQALPLGATETQTVWQVGGVTRDDRLHGTPCGLHDNETSQLLTTIAWLQMLPESFGFLYSPQSSQLCHPPSQVLFLPEAHAPQGPLHKEAGGRRGQHLPQHQRLSGGGWDQPSLRTVAWHGVDSVCTGHIAPLACVCGPPVLTDIAWGTAMTYIP
jgi:hypothetical protein